MWFDTPDALKPLLLNTPTKWSSRNHEYERFFFGSCRIVNPYYICSTVYDVNYLSNNIELYLLCKGMHCDLFYIVEITVYRSLFLFTSYSKMAFVWWFFLAKTQSTTQLSLKFCLKTQWFSLNHGFDLDLVFNKILIKYIEKLSQKIYFLF